MKATKTTMKAAGKIFVVLAVSFGLSQTICAYSQKMTLGGSAGGSSTPPFQTGMPPGQNPGTIMRGTAQPYGYALPGYGYGYGYGYGSRGMFVNPYALPSAPVVFVPAPLPVAGVAGFYRFSSVNRHYWLAPSGFYYPWGYSPIIGSYTPPIYYVDQGNAAPSRPPLSAFLSDMEKYIQDSKTKGLVSAGDYEHLLRRLNDLRAKHDHMLVQGGGTVETQDEDALYRDAYQLSGEIAMRIKAPAQQSAQ
jgi:hypothetical protein